LLLPRAYGSKALLVVEMDAPVVAHRSMKPRLCITVQIPCYFLVHMAQKRCLLLKWMHLLRRIAA
jgi:hypothetical protein